MECSDPERPLYGKYGKLGGHADRLELARKRSNLVIAT